MSTLHASSCSRGFASLPPFFFSLLLPSSLGLTDVEGLGTPTRIYCLHYFLCMILYAVSMLKKKKKSQQKQSTCFGQKKNRGCILSVRLGNMLLPLCASGLCVAVFCQHEISSPLEDLGEEEPHPQGLEEALIPPNLPGVLGGGWSRTDGGI